jgi:hypothetical protein
MEYAIFAALVVILILIAAVYGHMHRVSELLEEIAAQGRPAFPPREPTRMNPARLKESLRDDTEEWEIG